MSTKPYKWDDKQRHDFYADLLEKFGKWKFWDIKTNPFPKEQARKREEFDKYLEKAYAGKKPMAQLTWLGNMSALGLVPDPNSDLPTHEKPMVPQKFNMRNWMQNKCSAYFAGFVGDEVFPDTFDPHYPQTRTAAWGQDKVYGPGLDDLNDMFDRIPPSDEDLEKELLLLDFEI